MPTELILGQTFGLFYDSRLEQVVLVNGAIENGPDRPTELWRWSGEAWELLDAAGPPARSFAALGRDPEREVVVVHGGVDGAGEAFDETLEWDGRDWSVATATGPGHARVRASPTTPRHTRWCCSVARSALFSKRTRGRGTVAAGNRSLMQGHARGSSA